MKTRKTFDITRELSLLGLIALAHLPFGLPSDAGFVMPVLIVALVFTWSLNAAQNIQPWLIFSLGLIADVLSSGPIGYWPLYYLSAQALSIWIGGNPTNSGFIFSWIGFLFTAFITTFLAWAVASVYFTHSVDLRPMIIGAGLIGAAYPLIYWASANRAGHGRPGDNDELSIGAIK